MYWPGQQQQTRRDKRPARELDRCVIEPCLRKEQPASIHLVARLEELLEWREAWDRLAARALVANPFYESGALLPAIGEGLVGEGWQVLLVHENTSPSRLIGLFPIETRRFHPLIPQRVWRMLEHPYAFSTAPLVDLDQGEIAIDAVLDWLAGEGSLALDLTNIPVESPLHDLLQQRLRAMHMPRFVHNPVDRAALYPGASADHYLEEALRKKRRKELARQYRRLGELGRLEFKRLASDEDPSDWIEWFTALEARGWKGREGTAIAAHPAHQRYFARLVRNFHQSARIDICGLFLDGQPVALKCNLVGACDGPAGFAFKIAYDENHERFSPGVQLEIEQIIHMHGDDARAAWMDSCASSQHFMINRLWTERRRFTSFLVGAPTIRGRSTIKALEGAAALHRIYAGRDSVRREQQP